MSTSLGNQIMNLRKERGMTQEQLANELGISYQAVSKWETGVSCPDISTLPLLADLFDVSMDELFGREVPKAEPEVMEEEPAAQEQASGELGVQLPWPDDDTLHVVLFSGHTLVGHREDSGRRSGARRMIEFQYEGPALNIQSDFAVQIDGQVQGNITAGGDVTCDSVGGDITADGDVTCDEVRGNIKAGGDVTCDGVGGSVSAGGDVSCDDVDGNVNAGCDVTCETIGGNAMAGGDLNGGDLGGKGFPFHFKL